MSEGWKPKHNRWTVYLPAEGLLTSTFGGSGGLKVPDSTGQFHSYTLQGAFSQDAFELTAVYSLRGAEAATTAADLIESRTTRSGETQTRYLS